MSDATDIEKLSLKLIEATKKLHSLAQSVAHARAIKEFATDMRKNLLAKYVVRALKAGESATAAEALGRADPEFQRELEALQKQYGDAEGAISEWQAAHATWDSARSLLSMQRETLRTLEG